MGLPNEKVVDVMSSCSGVQINYSGLTKGVDDNKPLFLAVNISLTVHLKIIVKKTPLFPFLA